MMILSVTSNSVSCVLRLDSLRELTIDEIEVNSRFGVYEPGLVTRDELANVVEGHYVCVRQGVKANNETSRYSYTSLIRSTKYLLLLLLSLHDVLWYGDPTPQLFYLMTRR